MNKYFEYTMLYFSIKIRYCIRRIGSVAEWLKAPHSKRGIRHKRIEGSNPSASAMHKRRPWNDVSEVVYSISSCNQDGIPNMNIATYITPVTMKPKQYLIAVYRNTQTHANIFQKNNQFLLQALSTDSLPVVKIFGKKSGKTYDKVPAIVQATSHSWEGIPYLDTAAFVLVCNPVNYFVIGDHDVILVEIVRTIHHNRQDYLMTTHLYEKKIIG
jgi:flavin reductase (DIM6/NTAB) family NADH-FMN oxidoreductase RutF